MQSRNPDRPTASLLEAEPVKPRDRLLALAEQWAAATGRSLGALSSVVSNQGGTLDRLRDPATAVTDSTLEKFARFLADAANWPDGEVPDEARAFAHVCGVSAGTPALATGESDDLSGRAAAA
jgi:hypothetical protein